MSKIILTGITGQLGSYLAELLLEEGHEIYGIIRRGSTNTKERINHILDKITLIEGDITDPGFVYKTILEVKPDKIFNAAAQSHVWSSFQQPVLTNEATYIGCLNLLEAIRIIDPKIKFFQFSSSEQFGSSYSLVNGLKIQNESTPFIPQSPYAVSKLSAHLICKIYRDSYNIFASCGIFFNSESPRRGELFVTRKITKWIGDYYKWKESDLVRGCTEEHYDNDFIFCGKDKFPKLRLGNTKSYRDWSHAKDSMRAAVMIMNQPKPDNFIVSSQETHTIEQFLSKAFSFIGIEDYRNYVVIDPKFYRPAEVDYLLGDSSKIRSLGWRPEYNFESLVEEMVLEEIKL